MLRSRKEKKLNPWALKPIDIAPLLLKPSCKCNLSRPYQSKGTSCGDRDDECNVGRNIIEAHKVSWQGGAFLGKLKTKYRDSSQNPASQHFHFDFHRRSLLTLSSQHQYIHCVYTVYIYSIYCDLPTVHCNILTVWLCTTPHIPYTLFLCGSAGSYFKLEQLEFHFNLEWWWLRYKIWGNGIDEKILLQTEIGLRWLI